MVSQHVIVFCYFRVKIGLRFPIKHIVYITWNFAKHVRLEYLYYLVGEYFDPGNNVLYAKCVCKHVFQENCHNRALEKD